MSQQLKNKNIVIIGGTTGIGLSAQKHLLSRKRKLSWPEEMKKMLRRRKLNWEKMHMPFVLMQGKSRQR
jgi:short-subunit dehydrogenase